MTSLLPTRKNLEKIVQSRLGDQGPTWYARTRLRFGYFPKDIWYEATVDSLVTEETVWIDIGGGKTVFENNHALAQNLSERCSLLVGLDPSDNLDENQVVHQRVKSTLEKCRSERSFDLATLRMVAEHLPDPEAAVESLARLVKPGGRVVIYTPNRWSPISIASSIIPFRLHHPVKRLIWHTEEEDTFPTVYGMNTRRRLRHLFERGGFQETAFAYLDEATLLGKRPRMVYYVQLLLWRILQSAGLKCPENSLLGIYQKT